MSAISGAADYFGLEYSAPALFVESGYFAAINIQRDLKPCGPYCWNHAPIAKNLKSMGLCVNWLRSTLDCQTSDYREHMVEQICGVDARTVVCMAGLEFQLVCNRNEEKLTFTVPWGPEVPTCISELSLSDILAGNHFPGLAWFTIDQTQTLPITSRLRSSVDSAIVFYDQQQHPDESDYFFGPVAWEQWATKLESDSFDKHGHWWSSMVWSECRQQAAEYFNEEWSGPVDLGNELSTRFADTALLIAKAATQEMSNSERAVCIRQAGGIDAQIYQYLEACRDSLIDQEHY